ncbi:MAG: gephyrin-like molybdotransferase Glp [Eubacteriales bacterium]
MKKYISLEEAQSLLLEYCQPIGGEYVELPEAFGRIIRADIKAEEDIPPFTRSPLDGYAFIAEDTVNADRQNPVSLRVLEEVPAGYTASQKVVSGTTIKVMTGAPIPEGANAVEKYENIEVVGNKIKIFSSFKAQENTIAAGEDVKKGQVVVKIGTKITPPITGLLASLGINNVPVYKQPRAALVSTGDELIDADIAAPLKPGKIRNSTRVTLQGYLKDIGVEPVVIGTAKDKAEEVAFLIQQGLSKADMVITTGGVSVGDYDVVAEALNSIGAEIIFWKIDIKPGMPTMVAVKDGKIILGLSGNPASGLVVFQLLGIPFIRKMAGQSKYSLPKIEAVLQQEFRKPSPKRRFLRGKLVLENGVVNVKLTGSQGNAILSSMVGCNVLVEIPAGSEPLGIGKKVIAYLVDKID